MENCVVKALIGGGEVVVSAACTTGIVDEMKKIHGLRSVATAAIGRTVSAAAMMAAELKNEKDSLSIIIRGDGPLEGLVVCADGALSLKGYVYHGEVELPLNKKGKLDVGGAIGKGTLTVVKDLGLKEPYSGKIDLVSGEIAEDFAYYFLISQQQPSVVSLGVKVDRDHVLSSGGMIVQPLPGCSEEVLSKVEGKLQQIAGYNQYLSTGMEPYAIISEIFADMEPEFLEKRMLALHCGCSREKSEQVILSMGAEEIEDMIKKDNGAEVHCHFCNTTYSFTAGELQKLLDAAR